MWRLTAARRRLVCRVFCRFSRVLLIGTLCISIGGHWAALQSVAWVAMFATYSQQTSLTAAITQTFDGNHPCGLCKGISATKQHEKKGTAVTLSLKPDLICALQLINFLPRSSDIGFIAFAASCTARNSSPPVPPPRFELA